MTEAEIQVAVRLALGRLPNLKLFRNNRGKAWLGPATRLAAGQRIVAESGDVLVRHAQLVDFGLTDGASDLIGLKQVVVTPAMVGRKLAVFTALEVKAERGRASEAQINFVRFVREFGGRAGIVRSPEDAASVVDGIYD